MYTSERQTITVFRRWRGDLTVREAAELLAKCPQSIKNWDTGKTRPPRGVLMLMRAVREHGPIKPWSP